MMSPGFVLLSALKHGVWEDKIWLFLAGSRRFTLIPIQPKIPIVFLTFFPFSRCVQKIVLRAKPSEESRIDASQKWL